MTETFVGFSPRKKYTAMSVSKEIQKHIHYSFYLYVNIFVWCQRHKKKGRDVNVFAVRLNFASRLALHSIFFMQFVFFSCFLFFFFTTTIINSIIIIIKVEFIILRLNFFELEIYNGHWPVVWRNRFSAGLCFCFY